MAVKLCRVHTYNVEKREILSHRKKFRESNSLATSLENCCFHEIIVQSGLHTSVEITDFYCHSLSLNFREINVLLLFE